MATIKASDIVSKAESYIGTKEAPANSNNVLFNTEYYGKAVSGSSYPWCAVFVWYVFKKAGASSLFYGGNKTASCSTIMSYYKGKGKFYTEGKAGDIVIFGWGGSTAKHCGIVVSKSGNNYTTIEGNTSSTSNDNGGSVMKRTRAKSQIIGFCRPDYSSSSSSSSSSSTSKPTYKTGTTYTLQVDKLTVRKGAGTSYAKVTYANLTANAKKNAYSNGTLKKGTKVTCKAVKNNNNEIWMQIPSGWIAAYYNGKEYVS